MKISYDYNRPAGPYDSLRSRLYRQKGMTKEELNERLRNAESDLQRYIFSKPLIKIENLQTKFFIPNRPGAKVCEIIGEKEGHVYTISQESQGYAKGFRKEEKVIPAEDSLCFK